MTRIYITDIPATDPLVKAIEAWCELDQAAYDGFWEFVKKYVGIEGCKIYSNSKLLAVIPPKGTALLKGWRWVKAGGPMGMLPAARGDKVAYEAYKALKTRPSAMQLDIMCKVPRIIIGNTVYWVTFEYDKDEKLIVGLPVNAEGKHHPIPEGARELKTTEYMQRTKEPEHAS